MVAHTHTQLCAAFMHTCTHALFSGKWGDQSQPPECGSGTCTRNYVITTPQNECGKKCEHEGKTKTEKCQKFEEPRDCVEKWGKWSVCDKKCNGKMTRRKLVVTKPSNCPKSKACTAETEKKDCNKCDEDEEECTPKPCVTEPGEWSKCTVECGKGTKFMTPKIVKPAECGGKCSITVERKPEHGSFFLDHADGEL